MTKTLKTLFLTLMTVVVCSITVNAQENQSKDLVDTAIDAGSFTILAQALTNADLIEMLKSDGPYTIFAPTDAAFEKLPQGVLDSLLTDTEALKSLLLYHVVPGNLTTDKLVLLESATTAEGSDVSIEVDGSLIRINSHDVLTAHTASNGVLYTIDNILMPPSQ